MDIIIPTLGRASLRLQPTLNALCAAGLCPTVVVQPHEVEWWRVAAGESGVEFNVHELPTHIKGIAPTRDYIIHAMDGSDHVVMLDDDLHFAVRREDERDKFRQPFVSDIVEMMTRIDEALRLYPHVSIGSREGGNRVTEPLVWNTRMMRVLAYRRSFMKENYITFTPMEVMEDFHVTLQILLLGCDCVVLNNWVSNQAGGSDAGGGCSTFRTLDLQAENARRLAARFPGYVKTVLKQTKTAWGGRQRLDVVVQWKRAAKDGERNLK